MKNFWVIFKSLLTHRSCFGCGSLQVNAGPLCRSCWDALETKWTHPFPEPLKPHHRLLVRPLFHWAPRRSPLLSKLIIHSKEARPPEWDWVAERWLVQWRLQTLLERSPGRKQLLFVPVPSPRGRLHSMRLAEALSRQFGGDVVNCLVTTSLQQQRRLSRQERGARQMLLVEEFTALAHPNLQVILVDDVVTTGSTADACRRALGLADLEVWCLAYRRSLATTP